MAGPSFKILPAKKMPKLIFENVPILTEKNLRKFENA